MFFRPSFCANCGEKIERVDWGILTSRRFCEVCESEFKGHDLVPRIIVGFGVLAGIFGFGSYLKSGSNLSGAEHLRPQQKLVEQTASPTQVAAANRGLQQPGNADLASAIRSATHNSVSTPKNPNGLQASQLQVPKAGADEVVYYCGAETKKGTPCSRRVKKNTRCYQHAGMPSMAAEDKLSMKLR